MVCISAASLGCSPTSLARVPNPALQRTGSGSGDLLRWPPPSSPAPVAELGAVRPPERPPCKPSLRSCFWKSGNQFPVRRTSPCWRWIVPASPSRSAVPQRLSSPSPCMMPLSLRSLLPVQFCAWAEMDTRPCGSRLPSGYARREWLGSFARSFVSGLSPRRATVVLTRTQVHRSTHSHSSPHGLTTRSSEQRLAVGFSLRSTSFLASLCR